MSTKPRMVAPDARDDDADTSLRPQRLSEFVGQEQARANLNVFIEAARSRKEALDHVLFVGPPGLGKTTLAQIIARELGVSFRGTSGPVIAKAGDLAALLTLLLELFEGTGHGPHGHPQEGNRVDHARVPHLREAGERDDGRLADRL